MREQETPARVTERLSAGAGSASGDRPAASDLAGRAPAVLYMCLLDHRWSGVEITAGVAELAQVPPSRWLADPRFWLRLVHPEDRPRLVRARVDALGTGQMDCTYRIERPDGTVVWIQDEARCRGDRVYGVLRDVSRGHLAEEAMQDLEDFVAQELRQLQCRETARQALVRTFVHDVRSVLHRAGAIAAGLSDDAVCGPSVALEQLFGDLQGVAEDLLTISQSADDDIVRPRHVELARVVDAAITEVGAEGRTTVMVDAVPDLIADPILLRRILVNLVGNAVRHTPAGTPVRVHALRTPENVLITVEDDGPGFAVEDRPRIFEPSIRPTDTSDGWGLGLCLVEQLVALQGGWVSVDDVPGGGASFTVVIPQVPELMQTA